MTLVQSPVCIRLLR